MQRALGLNCLESSPPACPSCACELTEQGWCDVLTHASHGQEGRNHQELHLSTTDLFSVMPRVFGVHIPAAVLFCLTVSGSGLISFTRARLDESTQCWLLSNPLSMHAFQTLIVPMTMFFDLASQVLSSTDLVRKLLLLLPFPTICRLAKVCKLWREVASCDEIWSNVSFVRKWVCCREVRSLL